MALKYNPSYVPPRTRKLIVNKWLDGGDKKDIAKTYDIIPSTVDTYVNRYAEKGTVLSPYEIKKQSGIPITRKKKFDNPYMQALAQDTCIAKPSTSLTKYATEVFGNGNFCISASRSTVDRYFSHQGWTWKKASRQAMESDGMEEHLFWEYMDQIIGDKNQMIFLDESNRFDTTANPTHGRGKGRVYIKVSFTRGGYKFSLLSTCCAKGIVVYEIFPGAVNEKKLNGFVFDTLLHYVNPYPGDCSVIILDNIPFHHNNIFMELFMEYRSIVGFLPHYNPTLNLMEYGFRDIKAIEVSKGIYGEQAALQSLIDSVEKVRYKDYSKILKQIGYIK